MSQPKWKLVANIGDVNPVDHGGFFVYVDKTGVYSPEAAVLEANEDEKTWELSRFILETCTYGKEVNGEFVALDHYEDEGILSDNKFHPLHAAWFADPESKRKERPQDTCYFLDLVEGNDPELAWELIEQFCSDDPTQRALAWREVVARHGIYNLDEYPRTLDRQTIRPYRRISRALATLPKRSNQSNHGDTTWEAKNT